MRKRDRAGVLLIVTMDTKADEALYVEKCLQAEGMNVFIMDPGIHKGFRGQDITDLVFPDPGVLKGLRSQNIYLFCCTMD